MESYDYDVFCSSSPIADPHERAAEREARWYPIAQRGRESVVAPAAAIRDSDLPWRMVLARVCFWAGWMFLAAGLYLACVE